MTPWGASSSAKDESGVCLCVLVRIVHWVVLRVRCKENVASWFENVVAARIADVCWRFVVLMSRCLSFEVAQIVFELMISLIAR